MTRILHLTLHKKWFDLIQSREKRTEYREIKPYWTRRLMHRVFDEIHFKNGYAQDAPFMRVQYVGMREAMFQGIHCYAIDLGKILEVKNMDISGDKDENKRTR